MDRSSSTLRLSSPKRRARSFERRLVDNPDRGHLRRLISPGFSGLRPDHRHSEPIHRDEKQADWRSRRIVVVNRVYTSLRHLFVPSATTLVITGCYNSVRQAAGQYSFGGFPICRSEREGKLLYNLRPACVQTVPSTFGPHQHRRKSHAVIPVCLHPAFHKFRSACG
jgi:hypothetical protein